MLSHRLSPFCGLVHWEVFPGGFAVAYPPHAAFGGARDSSGAVRAGRAHAAPRAGYEEVSSPA